MEKLKIFCKKCLVLPVGLVALLIILCAAALPAVFVYGLDEHPVAYAVYAVSFYTLTVFCIACFKTIPDYYRNIKRSVYDNRYANRYLTDAVYKTRINLYMSLLVNIVYVVVNGVSAKIYNTHWFAIFAVYYGVMAAMRFILAIYVGKKGIGENRLGELKRSRACAYMLLSVNIALSGVVLMMVYYDRGFSYQGFLIYVMAVYTFYITIAAIVDLIKYRKYNSPVMSVTKVIKLTASLFSMLFLETAMFAQFGQDTTEEFKRIMIMATGAGISVIVVAMSLYIIVRYTKEIKDIKCKV